MAVRAAIRPVESPRAISWDPKVRFSKSADVPTLDTETTTFWVIDGILYGQSRPESPQRELRDAVNAMDALAELTAGIPMPLLFDARNLGWMQMDAREYIQAHAKEVFTRAAIVAKPDQAEMMTYALKDSQAAMPVRVFTDDEAAWRFASGLDGPDAAVP